MKQSKYLGEFEELVLIAVDRLGGEAYGMRIRQEIEKVGGRFTSIGAVYATLDRLERKQFVTSEQGEPTAERGGRAKRYFKLKPAGSQALNDAEAVRGRMRKDLAKGFEPIPV